MGVCTQVLVCVLICVYVSEDLMQHSPVVDLLLAAGQVSCVAASLYSGTAELGLQKLTHSNMHRHTNTYVLFFLFLTPSLPPC